MFASGTGGLVPVYDEFTGSLQPDGETLSLLQPATNGNLTIDRVRYESTAPWPTSPTQVAGGSLQLIDASQDNSRVANWRTVVPTNVQATNFALISYTNVWKYMQISNLDSENWTSAVYDDSAWPAGAGLLAFENNSAIIGLANTTLNDPRVETNSMSAGHAYYFRLALPVVNELSNYLVTATAYIDDGLVLYLNGNEITRIRMSSGTVLNSTAASNQAPDAGGDSTIQDTFTIPSSAFVVGTNILAASIHQPSADSSDIVFGLKLDAIRNVPTSSTPGQVNSVATNLPAFPALWLNEIQAENNTGPKDNYGEQDPWVELYNAGTNAISLNGYYLGTNYASALSWAFPANASLNAGQFLVIWLDAQTNQTSGTNWHANFRPNSGEGRIALSRIINGSAQIVDYLSYSPLAANRSYGDFPDGQPFFREAMFYATPGGTNNALASPINVFINEWMAENTAFLLNTNTVKYDDWFELYNPASTPADLAGYYLTDTLNNPFQFQIPAGFVVPAKGFLLIWADSKASANTNSQDLHVSFKLDKGGEAIGLFAPDGHAVDAIIFGGQTANISEGRYPDGGDLRLNQPAPSPRQANILPPASKPPTVTAMEYQATLGFRLTFDTSPGHVYRVEYKSQLSDPIWLPLGEDYFATGSTVSVTDDASSGQRFYRIVLTD